MSGDKKKKVPSHPAPLLFSSVHHHPYCFICQGISSTWGGCLWIKFPKTGIWHCNFPSKSLADLVKNEGSYVATGWKQSHLLDHDLHYLPLFLSFSYTPQQSIMWVALNFWLPNKLLNNSIRDNESLAKLLDFGRILRMTSDALTCHNPSPLKFPNLEKLGYQVGTSPSPDALACTFYQGLNILQVEGFQLHVFPHHHFLHGQISFTRSTTHFKFFKIM